MRSKRHLLLPLVPALALGVVEVATKVSVIANIASVTRAPPRGEASCVDCERPA